MFLRIVLAVGGLALIGVSYLAYKGTQKQEIRTQIEIAASPQVVWTSISDIDRWQEWSPIINKSSGTAALGEILQITMVGKEEGQEGPTYSPKVTLLEEGRRLRWRAHMMAEFIFTNEKLIELQETETGTKVVHSEFFSGLMAPLMCGHMEKGVPPMLHAMNSALKKRVESSTVVGQEQN